MSRAAWSTLVATAAVAVLAALVALTGSGPPPVTRTALVPGLAIGAVAQLELRRGDRGVTIDVARGRVIAPTAGAADGAAVTDLLSALAAARLDRRGGPAIARPRATIVLDVGRPRTIVLGDAVAATGQAWVAVDGEVALVPGWVGRALDRDPDELRQRRLVAPGAEPVALTVHVDALDLVLTGPALVRRDGGGRATRLDLAVRRALWDAVAALRLETFDPPVDPTAAPVGALEVRVGTRALELRWFAPCATAGLVQVATTIGDGCVAAAALDALVAAARIAATDAGIAATPLVTAAPVVALALADAQVRQDGGGWTIATGAGRWDAEPAQVQALVAALAAPATRRPRPADAAGGGGQAWTVIDASGERQAWTVRVDADAVTIVRDAEPVELALAPAAAALVRAGVLGLRGRQPLRLDPAQVARVQATGQAPATVVRGAVLGEWTVDAPRATAATAAAAALPAALAGLQVDRWAAPAALGRVRRTLTVERDVDAAITIAIGAADATGCWIAVDAAAAGHASAAACAALLAPLAAR